MRRTRPLKLCNSQENELGELVELGKVGCIHVEHPNMKIYPDESLPDLTRENLKFGWSRGKMVFSRLWVVF